MAELGAQQVALVHDGTSYPSNIATVAARMLTAPRPVGAPAQSQGLRLSTLGRLTQGATEHRKIADTVIASRADAVYFTGYVAEAGRLVRDLRTAGYHGVIMIADGCVDQALLEFFEGTAEGVYATMPPIAEHLSLPPGWSQEFARRAGHAPGPYTVQAYDAVTLAVDALRRADSRDGAAVTRALAATSGLELLSGPARFTANRTLEGFAFQLLRVRSGRFELVTSGDLPVNATPGSA